MQLKRILAKDTRSAMELATAQYGKDVLVVSSQSVAGQVELVVALDVQPEPPAPRPAAAETPSAFTAAFRRALGPMPDEPVDPLLAPAAARAAAPAPVAAPTPTPSPVPALAPVLAAADASPASPLAQAAVQAPQAAAARPVVAAVPAAAVDDSLRGREIIEAVRREIAVLRQEFQLSRQVQAWQAGQPCPPGVGPVLDALSELGVPAGLRALMIDSAQRAADAPGALQAMGQLLTDALSALPAAPIERGIHGLCGPSGAGKTLMAARLAAAASQRLGAQRVALVAFDDARCGAWSQMQVLAAQAGVACFRAADAQTLGLLLQELGSRELVLIDTAGTDGLAQAQRLRELVPGIGLHAVLAADASVGAVRRLLGSDAAWTSVLVSKLDESEAPWPLVQALCDRRLPVAGVAGAAEAQVPVAALDAAELVRAGLQRLADAAAAAEAAVAGEVTEVAEAARATVAPAEPAAPLEPVRAKGPAAPRSRARAAAAH